MISSQMSLIQSLDKKHNEMSELAIQIDFGLLVSSFCSVRYGLVDQKELFLSMTPQSILHQTAVRREDPGTIFLITT